MKKIITVLLGAVLLLAGCAGNTEVTQSPTVGGTTQATDAPTEAPTPEATPAPEDIDLLNINKDTNVNVVFQEDLSFYGVGMSEIEVAESKYAQDGAGLKISLGDTAHWCQGLQFVKGKAGDAFAQAGGRKYIRFWVGNPTNTKLGVMFILYKGGAEARATSTKATVVRCDGVAVELETGNPSGAGDNTSVILPAGFSGWVSFAIDDINADINFNVTEANGFKLDIRPLTPVDAEYYVLDDFTFTDNTSGELRDHKHELPKDSEEAYMQLRTELDAKIKSYLDVVPAVKYYPNYDPTGKSNIKAITYDGANIGNKKTKVFAYIGYPSNAKEGEKYPAVVLIHGGGGHAFHDWVTEWTKRGYVAIAMDNTGFFPNGPSADPYSGKDWTHGLAKNKDFKEDGYTNVMQTDHFATSGREIEKQWMYHAVVQAILAHNLLAADPMVDASKIGITGISWGSVVTALTIGYDKYAFAVPQYCAGYLNESLTYKGDYSKNYPAYNYLWQAEDRWDNVDFPVLWLQYTRDQSATPNTNSKCYLHTKDAGAEFTLIFNWAHGHDWSKEEVYYFANCAVNGKQAFTKAVDEPVGSNFSFKISIPEGATNVTARICYMKTPFERQESDSANIWYTTSASVSGDTVTGTVPEDATHYYVEFTTTIGGKSYYSATSIVYLDK